MTRFSANLGFLWTELSLPNAIHAAAKAGFDAVECHWPYDTPTPQVVAALAETGLQMLGLNTIRGKAGENGLCALPGRESDARTSIDQALVYANATATKAVHVMAGFGRGKAAHATFIANLKYACARAMPLGITVLIEPLNTYDAPGYFLQTTQQALAIIAEVQHPALRLMFDCYHVQIMEGDLTRKLEKCLPYIGHIQFASIPERAAPDGGEVCYQHIFNHIKKLGYTAPLGAEYKPTGATEKSLGWMGALRV